MEWFVAWVVFSSIVTWVWGERGLSFWTGFVVSVLLSPVLGLIIGLVMRPGQAAFSRERLTPREDAETVCR